MELDPGQVRQLKQRIKRQRQPVSRAEERPSRRIEGEVDSGQGDALGYGSLIVYVERGMGGHEELIRQVVQAAFDVQRDHQLRYWLCLFSFGWDDGALHHVGHAHQASMNTPARPFVKELCELAGGTAGPQPSVVPCLFPLADPYGQKHGVRPDDLLVFICSGRTVQMAEAAICCYQGLVARNAVWVFVGCEGPEVEFRYTPALTCAAEPTNGSEQMASTDPKRRRRLSPDFMRDLTTDGALLEPIWRLVKADRTLSLCIRNDYVNVYYRGGNLIRITRAGPGNYTFEFDCNYLKGYGQRSAHLPRPDYSALQPAGTVTDPQGVSVWLQQVPLLKFAMDLYMAGRHEPVPNVGKGAGACGGVGHLEREHQQLVERANNSDRSTDYFILDLEYPNPRHTNLRLDMVALRWPAKGRRQGKRQSLAVIEMKYGERAVSGDSGLEDHIRALKNALAGDAQWVKGLAREMAEVTAQRVDLGLSDWPGGGKPEPDAVKAQIHAAGDKGLEYIILIADYPPQSPRLWEELDRVAALGDLPFTVKIATANFMGYALHDCGVLGIDDFRGRYKSQVHSRNACPASAGEADGSPGGPAR